MCTFTKHEVLSEIVCCVENTGECNIIAALESQTRISGHKRGHQVMREAGLSHQSWLTDQTGTKMPCMTRGRQVFCDLEHSPHKLDKCGQQSKPGRGFGVCAFELDAVSAQVWKLKPLRASCGQSLEAKHMSWTSFPSVTMATGDTSQRPILDKTKDTGAGSCQVSETSTEQIGHKRQRSQQGRGQNFPSRSRAIVGRTATSHQG